MDGALRNYNFHIPFVGISTTLLKCTKNGSELHYQGFLGTVFYIVVEHINNCPLTTISNIMVTLSVSQIIIMDTVLHVKFSLRFHGRTSGFPEHKTVEGDLHLTAEDYSDKKTHNNFWWCMRM